MLYMFLDKFVVFLLFGSQIVERGHLVIKTCTITKNGPQSIKRKIFKLVTQIWLKLDQNHDCNFSNFFIKFQKTIKLLRINLFSISNFFFKFAFRDRNWKTWIQDLINCLCLEFLCDFWVKIGSDNFFSSCLFANLNLLNKGQKNSNIVRYNRQRDFNFNEGFEPLLFKWYRSFLEFMLNKVLQVDFNIFHRFNRIIQIKDIQ
jgi:hypothetical protein